MKKIRDQKYLYIRNGIYYFRVTIPIRYREVFGKSEIKESLDTSNLRDAIIKVCEKTAHYNSTINSIDQELSKNKTYYQNRNKVSKAEIERIVRKWFHEQLEMENIRLRAKRVGLDQIRKEEELKKELLKEAFIHSKPVELYTTWQIEDIIEKNNLDIEAYPELKEFLSELVTRGQIELTRRRFDELNGRAGTMYDIELFSPEKFIEDSITTKSSTITISQLIEAYENDPRHQNWAPKTMPEYQSIHRLIAEFFGPDKEVNSISREDCRRFQRMILQYPRDATKKYKSLSYQQKIVRAKAEGAKLLSTYTKNQYIRRLSALLKWGEREEYNLRNPAVGLAIKDDTPDDEKRDSFEIDDLKKLFSSTVYTGRKSGQYGIYKQGNMVIKDSRYWIPLIAVFNGARLNEMAQMRTSAIVEREGIACFSFTKQADDQKFKNPQSRRIIPIHPELIKVGFLNFVEAQKAENNDRLFPEVKPDKYGYYSRNLSKNFGYWLEKIGVKVTKNCFHSFRHTFRDALEDADVPIEIQERLGGWMDQSGKGSARKNYGRGPKIKKLLENIKKVKYPGLDLSHLNEG